MEHQEFIADPQQLLAEAEQEPRRRELEDYRETIRVLKEEKKFSFREIADWLQQRGLSIDHNAVWRIYLKSQVAVLDHRAGERNERSEHGRSHEDAMPWLKEP